MTKWLKTYYDRYLNLDDIVIIYIQEESPKEYSVNCKMTDGHDYFISESFLTYEEANAYKFTIKELGE